MKKIAIISDIHGNIQALEKVVADIQRRQVETVINLGDHISGPLWPRETAQFLMRQNWVNIAGNHDTQLVVRNPATYGLTDIYTDGIIESSVREWLAAQPTSLKMDGNLFLFHSTPANDPAYMLETIANGRTHLSSLSEVQSRLNGGQGKVLLCGHSHIPRVVELPDHTLIINPGSVGLPAYSDEIPQKHIVETGSPCARYATLEKDGDNWLVDLIAIPYDFNKAADQARDNSRPDWEIALRTGFAC
jgi:putative phosphoesterase